MIRKLICMLLAVSGIIGTINLSAQKKSTSGPSAKAKAATFKFNNCGDIWSVAADNKNIYVVIAWSKCMAVIDKATGVSSKITSGDGEINGVATHGNACYYSVVGKGVYRYNNATGQSEGPVFSFENGGYSGTDCGSMTISPDGHYLKCGEYIYDLLLGQQVGLCSGGRQCAINNLGGVYLTAPEALYHPLGGETYTISGNVVCNGIFADPVTSDAYYWCEQGVGYTPQIPQPEAGLQRVKPLQQYKVSCINRDGEGNFIYGLKDGIAIGGKEISDPLTLHTPLCTGIMEYNLELKLNSCDLILPDGQGNIIAADMYSGFMVIYNPSGLKGYSGVAGKAIVFN